MRCHSHSQLLLTQSTPVQSSPAQCSPVSEVVVIVDGCCVVVLSCKILLMLCGFELQLQCSCKKHIINETKVACYTIIHRVNVYLVYKADQCN